jgi:hypothetical protein
VNLIELENAIAAFREIIRQSWIRRAIRLLTLSQHITAGSKLSLADIASLRDKEWEERERTYHDVAIEDVNSLVRKHNGMAPYAVRRPYHIRSVEIEKMYEDCAEDILKGLAERMKEPMVKESELGTQIKTVGNVGQWWKAFDVIRQWFVIRIRGRWS